MPRLECGFEEDLNLDVIRLKKHSTRMFLNFRFGKVSDELYLKNFLKHFR